ncbi:E3 ubiquitin-protein ligase XIAP-like [Cloeon dipterum]|uniref:E3 ubiquitin-protein ligase XIAP-like n=1 Tax=Cloeon dipterum TaxID=197152 RepID=UPI00321F6B6B
MSLSKQHTHVVGGGQLAGPIPEQMLDRLNKDFAVHRLFTFPLEFYPRYSIELLGMVAELGFYFENPCIRCQFCGATIDGIEGYFAQGIEAAKKRILEKHDQANCPIGAADTKNLSMAIVTSLPDYRAEAHRLYSLLKKSDWQHVTPFDMARSGFYYSGVGDNVVCIYCNLAVSDWEDGDTPDNEHQESNPDCPFLDAKQSITNFEIGSEHEADANHDAIGTLKPGTTTFDPSKPPGKPSDRGAGKR